MRSILPDAPAASTVPLNLQPTRPPRLNWEPLNPGKRSSSRVAGLADHIRLGFVGRTADGASWLPVVCRNWRSIGVASGPECATRTRAMRWAESVLAHDGPLAAMLMLGDPGLAAMTDPLQRLLAVAPMVHVTFDGFTDLSASDEGYMKPVAAVRHGCSCLEPCGATGTTAVLSRELRDNPARAVALSMALAVAARMHSTPRTAGPGDIITDSADILPEPDGEPGAIGQEATMIARAAGLEVISAALTFTMLDPVCVSVASDGAVHAGVTQ